MNDVPFADDVVPEYLLIRKNCHTAYFTSPDILDACSNEPTLPGQTHANKATNVDMDAETRKFQLKTQRHWQDLAGIRGARVQYLELDIQDLRGENARQDDYIKYLQEKIDMVCEENRVLKRLCHFGDDKVLEVLDRKAFNSKSL